MTKGWCFFVVVKKKRGRLVTSKCIRGICDLLGPFVSGNLRAPVALFRTADN